MSDRTETSVHIRLYGVIFHEEVTFILTTVTNSNIYYGATYAVTRTTANDEHDYQGISFPVLRGMIY
jgi:hypothetical protein